MNIDLDTGGRMFVFAIHPADVELFGPERIALIHEVVCGVIAGNLQASFHAAVTGALRWHPNMRPEVLIDATGRML